MARKSKTFKIPAKTGPFEVGDIVKLKNEFGTGRIVRMDYPDGSICCWFGDKNPKGNRSMRSFMPKRLKHETRTTMLEAWRRQETGGQE